jgi:hypothetical protein
VSNRVMKIENWPDIGEVRVYGDQRNNFIGPVATITLIDNEIEMHFPKTTVMTKEQAAFILPKRSPPLLCL